MPASLQAISLLARVDRHWITPHQSKPVPGRYRRPGIVRTASRFMRWRYDGAAWSSGRRKRSQPFLSVEARMMFDPLKIRARCAPRTVAWGRGLVSGVLAAGLPLAPSSAASAVACGAQRGARVTALHGEAPRALTLVHLHGRFVP